MTNTQPSSPMSIVPQELLQTILNTVSEAITIVDRNGIVLFWNQAAE